jgi:hypothetical protein
MITLDAFLIFLAAASLPVIYVLLVSRWVEAEYRKVHSTRETELATLSGTPNRKAA